MFDSALGFPIMPPLVSFSGPIVGSGSTLLHDDSFSGLRDVQRKCCGFVQLSNFISPGNPTKTPYRGFHPFQVFVIFPIHVNPWTVLCKKMIDKYDTSFQPNTMFSCTGKVAGSLNHRTMVHPPPFTQDYVFIVVSDSWTFHDRSTRSSAATSLPTPFQLSTLPRIYLTGLNLCLRLNDQPRRQDHAQVNPLTLILLQLFPPVRFYPLATPIYPD
jgi:hypothetical protein